MEISEAIQALIIGFLEGDLDQDQADQLIHWLEKDKENIEYFRQIEQIWSTTRLNDSNEHDLRAGLKQIRNKIRERDIRDIPARDIRITVPTLLKVAASIAVLFILSIYSVYFFNGKGKLISPVISMVEASAPRGSRSHIILPDSTSIWLNSDTKLRYNTDYGVGNRIVYLDGEAYFKVAKNADLPFQVNTMEIKVTALGTSFNVKAYKDEETIETTLEEGQVSIDLLNPEMKNKSVEAVVLLPKQTAIYQKQEGVVNLDKEGVDNKTVSRVPVKPTNLNVLPVEVNEVADTRLYTSWKDTKWIFRNERLGSLAPKLERRYNITIQIADKQVEEYPFTGTLLEESLEQVLAVIQLSSPIKYEINSQVVKISEDKFLQKQYNNIIRNN